jgi:hypothetical protein
MAAMLSRLGGRGYCVAENSVPYGTKPEKVDPDPGPDFDFDWLPQPRDALAAGCWKVGSLGQATARDR